MQGDPATAICVRKTAHGLILPWKLFSHDRASGAGASMRRLHTVGRGVRTAEQLGPNRGSSSRGRDKIQEGRPRLRGMDGPRHRRRSQRRGDSGEVGNAAIAGVRELGTRGSGRVVRPARTFVGAEPVARSGHRRPKSSGCVSRGRIVTERPVRNAIGTASAAERRRRQKDNHDEVSQKPSRLHAILHWLSGSRAALPQSHRVGR
jgi:hypothetical protein